MLVGTKDILAFEHRILPERADGYVLGNFCLWAAGQRIGDFDDVQIMGAVAAQIEGALQDSGKRFHPELLPMNSDTVFRYLHNAVYGEGGGRPYDQVAKYQANDLSGLGVVGFDDLFVFLVDYPDGQGLHWADSHLKVISHARFDAYAFDRLAQEYMHVLNSAMGIRH